ncbi:MAG: ADP-ribosylglycohydrolase family protein, partial [Candidatus Omnitrophica bacterium]|nr:ADP-ribosylglycohydrolase family protein [Candidatus Omnitrophota bacterium]
NGTVRVFWHDYRHCVSSLRWINNIELYMDSRMPQGSFSSYDIRLTQTAAPHDGDNGYVPQVIAQTTGQIFLVWYDYHYNRNLADLFFARSNTQGEFSAPISLTTARLTDVAQRGNSISYTLPDIAVDSSGTAHIVWTRDNAAGYGLFYARQPASGTLTSPQLLSASGANFFDPPHIACSPQGDVFVAYTEYGTPAGGVYVQRLRAGRAAFDAPVKVTSIQSNQKHADLKSDSAGMLHLVWVDERNGHGEIFYGRFDPTTRTLLEEKIKGWLLAGAIGNAMGSPVEGKLWLEIEEKYPGGITTILDPSRLEGEDDNQMAMLLVETYLRVNGRPVMARDFGKTWLEKLNRDHFYIWCMGHAYDRLREGWDPRIIGHWSVVTGSTVMCLEPVGIYHLADPEFAAIDALAIAYMYQRGLDALAASLMAATVAEALKPEATVESICQTALQLAPEKPLLTFDRRPFTSTRQYLTTCLEIADRYTDVLAVRKELYDRCLFYHMIDPLEVWGLSLAMFKISRGDVRQAAIGGTNIGRDSDTIAGRAAMLAGALSGASNVPKEWVAMFPPASLQKIDQRTKQLVDLLAGQKMLLWEKRQRIFEEK